MSKRERVLATAVGVIVVVLLNVLVIDYFVRSQTRLRTDLALRTKQLKTMQSALGEKPMWEQREAWLHAKQPKVTNEDAAGGELLEQVRALAKKHTVVLDNPRVDAPSRRPEYTASSVGFQTKSSWKSLIGFLGELQTPEQFLVFQQATLKIDAADQTQMHGEFRIEKWFAPQ